ncbi:nitrous oxide reductase accessory protein NosL [Rasiella sp. SM2506]|uniref:nitrous oxide reductase accessory protein NosL n=1 Tax=Rasiella sp. SM2506 TaxID=3423914 RepID=UPI003D78BEC9
MKIVSKFCFVTIALFLMASCTTGPKSIDYGNDGCHSCKMTIIDKIHGAELITDKGKVFKFDATECMLNYIMANEELSARSLLTNYYETPTALIPTKEATFLISEKMPSPMGANLTAFKTKESAVKMQIEKGGELYTWETLKNHLER